MKQNTARDFLLLAAVAFREGRHDSAGTFFAQAMTSSDAPEMLAHLDAENELDEASLASDWEMPKDHDAPRVDLKAIASSVQEGLAAVPVLDEEPSAEEMPDLEDEEEEDQDDEDEGVGEFNEEVPGQRYIESSLSSSRQGGARVIVKLTSAAQSPIRVKP